MEEVAPEYDVVVMGTGMPLLRASDRVLQVVFGILLTRMIGLTECVLSG